MSFIDKYYAIFNNSVGQHSVTINRAEFANLLGVFSKQEQQLDQLKAENEEWKKVNDDILTTLSVIAKSNIKLRETLAEIKPILEFYANSTIGTDKGNGIFEFELSNENVLGGKLICCYDTNPVREALRKINEVVDEN